MNIFIKVTASACLAVLMSCASHQGSISSNSYDSNLTYKDISYGVSDAFQVFTFGGLSQDALVLEAKKNMILNRPLNQNEAYANITVDIKRTRIIVYTQTKVTVSADIVVLHNDSTRAVYSEEYLQKLNDKATGQSLFHIGDSVINKKLKSFEIIGFEEAGKVRLKYYSKKNKLKTKKVSVNKIYTDDSGYNGKTIGDHLDNSQFEGDVRYVGLKSFLYEDKSKTVHKAKY